MKFVIRRARRGLLKRNQWMFRIVAANGRVLAVSESYNNRADCEQTVAGIIFEARDAPVELDAP